jgi:hypothetical protein
MLHTHSGSSRRAFFDTSLRTSCGAGRACTDWTPTPTGGPRVQARDCEVADRVGELRKVAPVDEPVPHCAMPRSTSVQRMLRAATHRFFSFSSSPIPSGSDCRGVSSARLHNGAAGDGAAPRTQAHRQNYADRSPAVSGNPTGTHRSEGCSGLRAGIALDLAQSGGVQHLKILASEDRLGQDANARVLRVAATIAPRIHTHARRNYYFAF